MFRSTAFWCIQFCVAHQLVASMAEVKPSFGAQVEEVCRKLGDKNQGAWAHDENAGGSEFVPKKNLNAFEQSFAEALAAAAKDSTPLSHLDSRTPLYQKLHRSLSASEKEEFKAMNRDAKQSFKEAWLKKETSKMCEEKQAVQSWCQVDSTKGTYMSASKVFQEEGGQAEDVQPAINYITKAMSMGPPFCRWNDWTNRFDILYLRKEHVSSFTQSWTLFQKSQVKPECAGAMSAAKSTAGGGVSAGHASGSGAKSGEVASGGVASNDSGEEVPVIPAMLTTVAQTGGRLCV